MRMLVRVSGEGVRMPGVVVWVLVRMTVMVDDMADGVEYDRHRPEPEQND